MYRYLNLPFPSTPDLSFVSKYKNKDALLVNPKTNFKIIFADKDVNSYKNIPYDDEIEIDKDIKFDFQKDFEEWFNNNYSDKNLKIDSGGISITRPGGANTIHSDSHHIGNISRVKINFTFSDYNSQLEYVEQHSDDKIYTYKDETGCVISCIDENDCDVKQQIKHETWFPVLLDVKKFHRRNNRKCRTSSVVLSYNVRDSENNFIDFDIVEKILSTNLLPKDCKFNLLSDI